MNVALERMAKMATTIKSSTSVKPFFWILFDVVCILLFCYFPRPATGQGSPLLEAATFNYAFIIQVR